MKTRSNFRAIHPRLQCIEWGVAQLAERLAVTQEVAGSNPAAPVQDGTWKMRFT